jgi:glutamate-1-semialdehyde 2,1-aminomutase
VEATQVDGRKALARFEGKTRKSAEMHRRALRVTPGGVMAGIKFFEPYPIFMQRAKGSHVWDVDGNEYVDYLLSYGAIMLGHGDEAVRRSLEQTLESVGTTVMGTPTALESEYGGMLRDIYHRDGMIRFTNSGLEATLLAARLAKGYTGRRKVAKFEGHYHGAVDHFLFSYAPEVARAGDPESPTPIGDSADVDEGILSESVVLPFNDWEATERILRERSDEISCVIMEPFEEGVIPAERAFMLNLRGLTRDLGVPLVFDEVKTGFRVRLGGAGEFYSVTPDLTCLGKIIGGGLPIGAVVGDAEIMSLLDPRRGAGRKVFHSGTFNGNPLSLSAGMATVEELSRRGRFEGVSRRTEDLKQEMSKELSARSIAHAVEGEGAMFNVYLTDKRVRNYRDAKSSDLKLRRVIDLELMSRGVYLKPENRFCLSLAHSGDDVRRTGERFREALDALAYGPRRGEATPQ